MSELMVFTRPELLDGYRLAGVEAYSAANADQAASQLRRLLDSGRGGLAAIDAGLLQGLPPALMNRLRKSRELFHVAIPGVAVEETADEQEQRLLGMIRRAIGFHISFGDGEEKVES